LITMYTNVVLFPMFSFTTFAITTLASKEKRLFTLLPSSQKVETSNMNFQLVMASITRDLPTQVVLLTGVHQRCFPLDTGMEFVPTSSRGLMQEK